jgi:hypothetical protein
MPYHPQYEDERRVRKPVRSIQGHVAGQSVTFPRNLALCGLLG